MLERLQVCLEQLLNIGLLAMSILECFQALISLLELLNFEGKPADLVLQAPLLPFKPLY